MLTPKSMRLQIALVGRMNAGKSSVMNLLTGQSVSLVSSMPGTTTDVVEKNQELPDLGPVTWIDTAGLDDVGPLGKARREKAFNALEKADIVLVVCEGDKVPQDLIASIRKPMIYLFNKADLYPVHADGFWINALDFSARDKVLERLQQEIRSHLPAVPEKTVLSDLVPNNGTIVLIAPIDEEAPKGRLIMPQVQVLRDALDKHLKTILVQPAEYAEALAMLKNPPDLVICDSQALKIMIEKTPADIACTTFSVLFARLKGDLNQFITGARRIRTLQKGDKVLIAEACTHHAVTDDIARVKIPALFRACGIEVDFNWVSGGDFPADLSDYALVVHCGGCMINRTQMLARQERAFKAQVMMTNYGLCMAELQGYLDRITAVFEKESGI